MLKKGNAVPLGNAMDGRIIYDYEISQLEGRILTMIESFGLRESQEKSAKDIFKDIFYRTIYFDIKQVHGEYLNEAIAKSRAKGEVGHGSCR